MFGPEGGFHPLAVTLYTDSTIVQGTARTLHRRLSDLLNTQDGGLIVLESAKLQVYGTRGGAQSAQFAQVNLGALLFTVSDEAVEPTPEMRMPKVGRQALIALPPFWILGRLHLTASENEREALEELRGSFLPLTDATYWSESLKVERTAASLVIFNRARAQILEPHGEEASWMEARAAALRLAQEGRAGA
ncbi:MAG TPA: hypothetical protein VFW86_03135 [Candidatus Limnocylindrales bacterium]|jgi:hypothetical protein|nr:hypothetical protein [Candidatus Limnocylindrales bacterium]